MEALKPFKVDNYQQEPKPFPYLQHSDKYSYNIDLTVKIQPENGVATTGMDHAFQSYNVHKQKM